MRLTLDIGENLNRAIARFGCSNQLDRIEEKINIIMANQEEFDAKINAANAAIDTVSTQLTAVSEAITAESAQIADWIAANPTLNTTSLDGVVARLNSAAQNTAGLATSVSEIFTPEPVVPQEPNHTIE